MLHLDVLSGLFIVSEHIVERPTSEMSIFNVLICQSFVPVQYFSHYLYFYLKNIVLFFDLNILVRLQHEEHHLA